MNKICKGFLLFTVTAFLGYFTPAYTVDCKHNKDHKKFRNLFCGKKHRHHDKHDKHCVKKDKNAIPAIIIDDTSNFDGFVATILLQKARNIDIRLFVANYGYGNIAPSMNNIFNVLAWLGNKQTPVVPGTYFTDQEILAGPNPGFEDVPGVNSARKGQMAQPIYNMFIPPLWKENSSVLYGQVGRIPVTKDPNRQYKSINNLIEPFIPAEDHIAEALNQVQLEGKKAIIFTTGPQSDLAKFLTKYPDIYDDAIEKIVIMGGGFFNFTNPEDSNNQRWAGNVFTDQIYSLTSADPIPPGYNISAIDWAQKSQYRTMQESNIFTNPTAAGIVFDYIADHGLNAIVLPTDATDPVLIAENLNSLQFSPTPEGKLVYHILQGIRDFENGGFDFVISAWDILAALAILNPEIIDPSGNYEHVTVDVKQLDSITNLQQSVNPYNVLQYDPYVGQTTLTEDQGTNITVVTKINQNIVFESILNRLNAKTNSAISEMNY